MRFRVLLDGQPPGAAHGLDVDAQGDGTVTTPRLYQLIRQAQPIADREFALNFLDGGVEAYVFIFGCATAMAAHQVTHAHLTTAGDR